ncbi:MAG: outer rane efflux protein [Cyanobacteria bacterium RYN_339]|nr:outer rane efflux protein [Cyanobacteria bacterium RYN_339]
MFKAFYPSALASLVLTAAVVLSPLSAIAAPPKAVTLAQALALATANNRLLQASKYASTSAAAGLHQAEASRLPNLSAGMTGSNTVGFSHVAPSMTLAYDLDTHGERGARIQIAKLQAGAAELELDRQARSVRFDVIGAYYDLQGADDLVRITALNAKNAELSLADARALRRGGEGTEFDIQRSQVQLSLAHQAQADAERTRAVSRRLLARLLGMAPGAEAEAADPIKVVGTWPMSLDASIARAHENRPELAISDRQVAVAKAQRQLALAPLWPHTDVFVTADSPDVLTPGVASASSLPGNMGYTVGARLNWLLFDGGGARQGAAQAEAQTASAEAQRSDTELQVELDVVQAFADMQAGLKNIEASVQGLDVARLGLDSARARFKGGVGTQTDVLLAQNDIYQAESGKLRAVLNYNKALAALERSCAQAPGGIVVPR